jgi:hypothetical protein
MATAELMSTSSPMSASGEADVYAAIATSWYRSNPRDRHIQKPMQPFVVDPGFAASLARWPDAVYEHVIAACARIVSLHSWELAGMQVAEHAEGAGTPPQECLDPLTPQWCPLGRASASGLGVHFWRLGGGVIEIRSVGPFNIAPALQFGRFAAAEQKLEEDVRQAVARTTREPR